MVGTIREVLPQEASAFSLHPSGGRRMIWARMAMAWVGEAVHGTVSVSVHCRPMVGELQVIEDEMDTWLDLSRTNFDQGTELALVHLR